MNMLSGRFFKEANEKAIFILYLYLTDKLTPYEGETLKSITEELETKLSEHEPGLWTDRDILRLRILKNAINQNSVLAHSQISDYTYSKSGLTACVFTKPSGDISVVFRGTGDGEWIDNGEGLSGVPEENTYITQDGTQIIEKDYATDQQVEALNWFNGIAAKNRWNEQSNITVSGHSKGGNKAQFITINSDLPNICYSFDGQGFSPEAIAQFKNQHRAKFESRRQKIKSISAANDYVNVLGEHLATKNNIYFLKSVSGFHYLESILDINGNLLSQAAQGKLSKYIENVSKELMLLPPALRQYATLGIMNIFQKYMGEGTPVNGDKVSIEKTIAGLGVTLGPLLSSIPYIKQKK